MAKKKVIKYIAVLEKDPDGGYVVTIPALPGCVSQGDTVEEALANIKEAAELWLEVMEEDKEEIPIPESMVLAPVEVTLP